LFRLAVAAVAMSAKPGVRPQARALSMHSRKVCGGRVEGKDARTTGMFGFVPPLPQRVGLSRGSFTVCLGDAVPDFGGGYKGQADHVASPCDPIHQIVRRVGTLARRAPKCHVCRSDISNDAIALWGPGALGNLAVLQGRHGQEAPETWGRGKTFSFFPGQHDGLLATMSRDGESFAFYGIGDNGRKVCLGILQLNFTHASPPHDYSRHMAPRAWFNTLIARKEPIGFSRAAIR
jgi:hypothetical protein